jgi:hypothetical protein
MRKVPASASSCSSKARQHWRSLGGEKEGGGCPSWGMRQGQRVVGLAQEEALAEGRQAVLAEHQGVLVGCGTPSSQGAGCGGEACLRVLPLVALR